MISFEFSHFYPTFEQQKFWDFLLDNEYHSASDVLLGEVVIVEPGEGHAQGMGAIRNILIPDHKINLMEKIVGFDEPKYFSYQVQQGGTGMPVDDYRGEFFLENKDDGLAFRYQGTFTPKLFGTNWLFKSIFRWRMKTMIPIWAEAYEAYYSQ